VIFFFILFGELFALASGNYFSIFSLWNARREIKAILEWQCAMKGDSVMQLIRVSVIVNG
jgi:hypothetical protein